MRGAVGIERHQNNREPWEEFLEFAASVNGFRSIISDGRINMNNSESDALLLNDGCAHFHKNTTLTKGNSNDIIAQKSGKRNGDVKKWNWKY